LIENSVVTFQRRSIYLDKSFLSSIKKINESIGSLSYSSFKNEINLDYFVKSFFNINGLQSNIKISIKSIFLDNLYVNECFRNKGLASDLILDMCDREKPDKVFLLKSDFKGLDIFYEKAFILCNYKLYYSNKNLLVFSRKPNK